MGFEQRGKLKAQRMRLTLSKFRTLIKVETQQPTTNNMQERSPEIKEFIRRNAALFWYIPDDKKEDISDETLMEFILNYGSMDDVLQLKKLWGMDYFSSLFLNLKGRKKLNYYPEIYNLFHLYFSKYAQRNFGQ